MTSWQKTGAHLFYIGMYIHIYTHIYVHKYTSQKECLHIFSPSPRRKVTCNKAGACPTCILRGYSAAYGDFKGLDGICFRSAHDSAIFDVPLQRSGCVFRPVRTCCWIGRWVAPTETGDAFLLLLSCFFHSIYLPFWSFSYLFCRQTLCFWEVTCLLLLLILPRQTFCHCLGHHLLLIGNQGVGKNKLTDRLLGLLQCERVLCQHLTLSVNQDGLHCSTYLVAGEFIL